MITVEMMGKIRRMYLRDNLSLHEIAKRAGLSRNTIQGWLRKPEEVSRPIYRRTEGPGKLKMFYQALEQALKVDAHRLPQNRRSAKALFIQIKADGGHTIGRIMLAAIKPMNVYLAHTALPMSNPFIRHLQANCSRVMGPELNAAVVLE